LRQTSAGRSVLRLNSGSNAARRYKLFFQASWWPIFQLHAQRQTTGCQNFFDFVQRLATQIWCLQQFIFTTLDLITDVVNVFCFQAVSRTYCQFQIIHWTQQNWINCRSAGWCFSSSFSALQCCKYVQLINQNASRLTDRFFWRDHTICLDVDDQLIQISTLLNTSGLNCIRNTAYWRERRIQNHTANRFVRIFRQTTNVTWYVAATFFYFDLHVELTASGQISDYVIWVDQFYIVWQIDIGSQYSAFAIFLQSQSDFITVVQLEYNAFQVQQNINDVFLHAIKGRILMNNTTDSNFCWCVACHR